MAIRKFAWRIGPAQQGVRLDHFLAEALPPALAREVTRSQVRRLIMAGAVARNGRRERIASFALETGTRIEAAIDLAKLDPVGPGGLRQPTIKAFDWTAERLLFEDEWLLLVDKPIGLPTHPTLDPSRASVVSTLRDFLQRRDGRPPYLGIHHRLDRDTSGVLLFTKDPKANPGAAELFVGKALRKTYHALSAAGPELPDQCELLKSLGVVGRAGKASVFGAVNSGGDPALTFFRVLERLQAAALIEAQPHTGRTHQIRVHLAEGGNPICGDVFYGGPALGRSPAGAPLRFPRPMLHAAALAFLHPVTQQALTVCSPLPADFAACVQSLREGGRR